MSDTEISTAPGDEAFDAAPAEDPDVDAPAASETTRPAKRLSRSERRGRIPKWDRAPAPKDWRWYVGSVGKILITVGLLMFAFVGYQLYGTGLETAVAQNRLEDDFAAQLAQFDVVATPPMDDDAGSAPSAETNTGVDEQPTQTNSDDLFDETTPDDAAADGTTTDDDATGEPDTNGDTVPTEPPPVVVPAAEQVIPALEDGDALARLEIPAIDVENIVVAGVDKTDLKQGPGHFPDTPLPGQLGNAAIAGHRTTYGEPFRNVDRLAPGDEIRITTLNGAFVYRVTGTQIVSPEDYQVVATTDPNKATLTLVSCHPVFTARERIIIFSELDVDASNAVGEAVLNYGRPDDPAPIDELPGEDIGVDAGVVNSAASNDGDAEQLDDIVVSDPAEPDEIDDSDGGADDLDEAAPSPDIAQSDTDLLGSDEVNAGIADAFSDGWFSDPGANPQVGLWGLILGAVSIAAYAISRRFRRDWAGLAVGIVPFLGALYFFFQNVIRLLPPNL